MEYVEAAPGRGVEVFIAAAGGAAHLPGVVAAHTLLPVLGVPVETPGPSGDWTRCSPS
ncbi:1-(5-Phosphoribosyl)-5-amino-4-imidazole-carboxylate (AIR) carboxylase domain protein, partial [mine drainage metagenome]